MGFLTRSIVIIFYFFKNRMFFLLGYSPIFKLLGFGLFVSEEKKAARFVSFLEDLGPSFIKLGQIISGRSEFLGKTLSDKLANFYDKTKVVPFEKAKKIIEESLGQSIEKTFKEFYKNEVASASIAQVYKAMLYDGTEVAVKMLKPKVREIIEQDVIFLRVFFKFLEKISKRASKVKLIKVVDTMEEIFSFELDLQFEAASNEELRENSKETKNLMLPKVFWQHSSKDLLVLEWVEGIKIYEALALKKSGYSLEQISHNLLSIFLEQVIKKGTFHGDLHPGNILVLEGNKIALVDFGIMGRLSEDLKIYIGEVFYAFLHRDYHKVAEIHFKAGWTPEGNNKEHFVLAIRAIFESVINIEEESKVSISNLLSQLLNVTKIFNMEVQDNLLILQKNMLLVEGILRQLIPNNNIWQLSKQILDEEKYKEFLLKKKAKYFLKKIFSQKNIINNFNNFLEENSKKQIVEEKKSSNVLTVIMILLLLVNIILLVYGRL